MNKMNMLTGSVLSIVGLLVATVAAAETETEKLKRILTEELVSSVEDIRPSPVTGVYQVNLGGRIVYVTKDGRYLLHGRLYDLKTRENLTEKTLAAQRLKALAAVPEDRMIIFEPGGPTRHTVTAFTDIDCPYCRNLHSQLDVLSSMGIRVRYMFYPRTGIGSLSYQKAVSVWCAPDPHIEMAHAKSGALPEARTCEHPVDEHIALAEYLQITGTPFIITDTGRAMSGYTSASSLAQILDEDKDKLARR